MSTPHSRLNRDFVAKNIQNTFTLMDSPIVSFGSSTNVLTTKPFCSGMWEQAGVGVRIPTLMDSVFVGSGLSTNVLTMKPFCSPLWEQAGVGMSTPHSGQRRDFVAHTIQNLQLENPEDPTEGNTSGR